LINVDSNVAPFGCVENIQEISSLAFNEREEETEYSIGPMRLDLLTAGLRMASFYVVYTCRVVVRSEAGSLS
jgi:hypothetical protein